MPEQGFVRPALPFVETDHNCRNWHWPRFWWIHLLLLAATAVTTTVYGAAVTACFRARRPLNVDVMLASYSLLFQANPHILEGLAFSIPLLTILMAHELGHYFACRHWRVEATLPFFLPSPFLLGTAGAFIRIRSPIYRRRILFDIGVSGPLAGFAVLLPILAAGVLLSVTAPHISSGGEYVFGTPLLLRIAEWLRFRSAAPGDIALHPFAQAAWGGLLATAINMLPIGQLDGGHIVYAVFGPMHRTVSRVFLTVLIPMGYFFSYTWFVWAVILFILGIRHPLVYDEAPLDRTRKLVAAVAFVILVLSLSLTPVRSR